MVAKVKVVKDFPPFQQNGCKLVYHWNGDDENLSGDVLPSVLKRRENRPRLDPISQAVAISRLARLRTTDGRQGDVSLGGRALLTSLPAMIAAPAKSCYTTRTLALLFCKNLQILQLYFVRTRN